MIDRKANFTRHKARPFGWCVTGVKVTKIGDNVSVSRAHAGVLLAND